MDWVSRLTTHSEAVESVGLYCISPPTAAGAVTPRRRRWPSVAGSQNDARPSDSVLTRGGSVQQVCGHVWRVHLSRAGTISYTALNNRALPVLIEPHSMIRNCSKCSFDLVYRYNSV